jgi:hypothetical protein
MFPGRFPAIAIKMGFHLESEYVYRNLSIVCSTIFLQTSFAIFVVSTFVSTYLCMDISTYVPMYVCTHLGIGISAPQPFYCQIDPASISFQLFI